MRDKNGLSFLQSLAVSAVSGAGSGVIRNVTNMPNEVGDNMTKQFVDIGLRTADILKRKSNGEDVSPWYFRQ